MGYKDEIKKLKLILDDLNKNSDYDVDRFATSLVHLATQLNFFYNTLAKKKKTKYKEPFYNIVNPPKEHQLAYFNIGRGFPKELMDAHWCYILKSFNSKMLVIPCTSIKDNSSECNSDYEKDIIINFDGEIEKSRMQLTDIRCIDAQRLDIRKQLIDVVTPREEILNFVSKRLFDEKEKEYDHEDTVGECL